ncbi:MAG TPA: hypothetical protein VN605_07785, partial [Thermoanaerobaculia bacterium]|nr:hypothetical protein [Thermoanaerobaculia bacterium]
VGLPGLNGFVGEFLILSGSFKTHPAWTTIATTGVILAAIYLLWLVQRVFYGPITIEENKHIPEIAWNEVAAVVPLIVLMVWIGVHPNTFLRKMTPSVKQLLATVNGEQSEKKVMEAEKLRVTGYGLRRHLVASTSSPGSASATRNPQLVTAPSRQPATATGGGQ